MMMGTLYFATVGAALGLSAGLAPGPLLTLVISETLGYGFRSGVKVALAPIITDWPVIVLVLFVLSRLAHFRTLLGLISVAGGCFVLAMAYRNMRVRGIDVSGQGAKPKSLAKGMTVNVLNPNTYLFWLSVGGPTMTEAMDLGIKALLAFLAAFYATLVGSNVAVAFAAGRWKSLVGGKAYIYSMRFLGLVLGALAVVLFVDGLRLLKIVTV